MMAFLYRILGRHRHTAGEFVRFGTVGVVNTVLDFAIYVGLTRGFAYWEQNFLYANAIAIGISVTCSFVLNNFWTFRKDGRDWHLRSAKFLTVCAVALVWNSLIMFVLTSLGFHDLASKIAATAVVALWNFTMYKMWAFRG